MIDARLHPVIRCWLDLPARALVRVGVGANQITLVGFFIGVLALPALAFDHFWLALLAILVNRLLDGLDGAVAQVTSASDRGAFIDIAFDFVFYALVPLGFALADPAANALPAVVLIVAFVGSGSSFLAFAVIAGKRGMEPKAYPNKGIYYLGGLAEGAETISFFIVVCLFPEVFVPLAYLFAFACAITTLFRLLHGWKTFT
ncbi:MAG: CDP-alcohol phosphatidyltransferase family protein [Paracoccaceae bacterium]|nr:CDP-alcohol phosphatidyltransferase family protein [Paracoccaceae bacterium]